MSKVRILILIFMLFSVKLYSQTFRATANPDVVSVGDRLTVTYSIDADGSNFRAPHFDNFKVLMGPSQSQNIQIINGQMTRSLSYSFILEATKEGKFVLPSAIITSNGKQISSNTVQVMVTNPSQAKLEQMKKDKEQNQNLENQAKEIINKNLKVVVSVDKTTVYEGEPVVATYKLYLHPQLNVLQLTPDKVPQLNGFWNQEIDLGDIKYGLEQLNGTTYRAAVIKKVILFPQQSGNLTVDSYSFNTAVRLQLQNQRRQRSRDPFSNFFDDFFNDPFFNSSYKDFQTVVTSPSIQINVKPLPKNAPVGFTNAVGDFTVNSWLDKASVKTGEAVTLKLKISGQGNMKLITPPKLDLPSNLEVYDPKTNDNTKVTQNNISGDLIFEYVIIPQTPGDYKIPPFQFSYFDLNSKQYKTTQTNELTLKVTQGDLQSYSGNEVNKSDVQLLNQDIDYIKTDIGTNVSQMASFPSVLFLILFILPIILFILFLIWRRKQKEYLENQSAFRKMKAKKLAKKRLETSHKYLQESNFDKFLEELTRAMWGFLSDKFSIETSKLTRENIGDVLRSKNATDDTINSVIDVLDKCEFARYAPSQFNDNMQSLYLTTETIISDLEEKLK